MFFPLEGIGFFAEQKVISPSVPRIPSETFVVFFRSASQALHAFRALQRGKQGLEDHFFAGGAGFGGDFLRHWLPPGVDASPSNHWPYGRGDRRLIGLFV